MSTREQVLQILEPIATGMGLDLEDVEIKSAGKNSIQLPLTQLVSGQYLLTIKDSSALKKQVLKIQKL